MIEFEIYVCKWSQILIFTQAKINHSRMFLQISNIFKIQFVLVVELLYICKSIERNIIIPENK